MPIHQLADAAASSTVTGAITNSQTSVTLASAAGYPGIVQGGQLSVIILDTGNPSYSAASPLATTYEYQQVNAIAGNVLTFGPGGGAAARSSYAGTTPSAFFAGATVAMVLLAEDIVASAPWKFDEQTPSGTGTVTIPASGSIPSTYLGVAYRNIEVWIEARSTAAALNADISCRLNGDSGANYSYNQLYANNNAAVGGGVVGTNSPLVARVPAATAPSQFSGTSKVIIPSFARTTWYKTAIANSMSFEGASVANFWTLLRVINWASTSAVTSLSLVLSAGNFVSGSIISTYLIP